MNFNRWIGTSLMLASLAGSTQILGRRRQRDAAGRTVLLAVDYDDCLEISTRSGVDLGELLHDLWHRGASHVAIVEQTLGDLLDAGSVLPAQPPVTIPTTGLTYLTASDRRLLERVATALAIRVPHLAHLTPEAIDDRLYLGIPGSLKYLRGVTVGFEPAVFAQAQAAGLVPVARPRHYPWPHPAAIEAVLAQAAALGSPVIAFADNYVLGHEMFMQATIQALRSHHLTPVYFAESRHQKGDWFIAKACLPNVLLGHEFAPNELDLEDEHGMAHKWGRMTERGIRFFSVRTMRGVHATDPLSLRDYVSMVAGELVTGRGLQLADRPDFAPPAPHHHGHGHHHHSHEHEHVHEHVHDGGHEPDDDHPHDHDAIHTRETFYQTHEPAPDDPPDRAHHAAHTHDHDAAAHSHAPESLATTPAEPARDLQWVALAAAGAGGIAAAETLGLPEPWASLLTLGAAGAGWFAVPLVDRPRSQLEATFVPSYAPKAIGLGVAVATPIAGMAGLLHDPSRGPAEMVDLLLAVVINGAAAAALAATTAGEPYTKRVEEFRSYNLDWAVPLGLVLGRAVGRPGRERVTAMAGAGLAGLGAWLLSSRGRLPADLLGPWSNRPLAGHTHHLSAFQARLGDLGLAASPQPLAKWGWLLPLGAALATANAPTRTVGLIAATMGSIALLAPFRQGAPALDDTIEAGIRGLTAGLVRGVRAAGISPAGSDLPS